jgi:outer membrane usher protein FimD/PapC
MKKKTVWIILLVIIVGAGIGIAVVWNKPHRNAANEDAIPVTAVNLFKEYSSNETTANSKYLNKNLEVTGQVASLDTNQDGAVAVILQTDDIMSGIMCTMHDKGVPVKTGETVTVKGFCSGFVSDVKLTDCVLKK